MDTAATIISQSHANDAGSDAVNDLLGERERVAEELARLALIDGPVHAAEAAVAGIDRAIETLDADERSRSKEWAAAGVGAPPEPRTAERRSLVARRADLVSDVDAARNRAGAIVPRRAALNAEIARIGRELLMRRIREAVEEGVRLNNEAHGIVAQALEPLTQIAGLRQALISLGNAQQNAGANGTAHEAFGAAEKLAALPLPNVSFDGATLNRCVTKWMGRLR